MLAEPQGFLPHFRISGHLICIAANVYKSQLCCRDPKDAEEAHRAAEEEAARLGHLLHMALKADTPQWRCRGPKDAEEARRWQRLR